MNKRLTIASLKSVVTPGVEVKENKGLGIIHVTAPDGWICAMTDLHYIDYHYAPEVPEQRQEALGDAIEDWGSGLDPCEIDDCEICNEDNDDE